MDRSDDKGLFNLLNHLDVRKHISAFNVQDLALDRRHPVNNRGGCGNQLNIEFALQSFLNNLHVEKTKKTTTKAKPQSKGVFRFKGKGGIIQTQFFQGVAQGIVLTTVNGIKTRKYHRFNHLVARQSLYCRLMMMGQGITDLGVFNHLDAGNDEPYFAGSEVL